MRRLLLMLFKRSAVRAAMLCLLLATAPAGGFSVSATGVGSEYFDAVWPRRHIFAENGYVLCVLKITGSTSTGRNSVALSVSLQAELSGAEGFRPHDRQVRVSYSEREPFVVPPGDSLHLAMLQPDSPTWRLLEVVPLRQPIPGINRTLARRWLLPLSDDGELAGAIGELCFGADQAGRPVDLFERAMHYIGSGDAQVRAFAACVIGAGGLLGESEVASARQADAFARVLLDEADDSVRRQMAKAYWSCGVDLLPRDGQLLHSLFAHWDDRTAGPALRDNLRHARHRGGELAGMLREILGGKLGRVRQGFALAGLEGWGPYAQIFQEELETLARDGEAVADHRSRALALLVAAEAVGVDELILNAYSGAPAAAALEHAAMRGVHGFAPVLIDAVREGRLAWSRPHGDALFVLTGRFPYGQFEDYDQWWSQVLRDGRAGEMVERGFVDDETLGEAEALLGQLGSDRYEERALARERLTDFAGAVMPLLPAAAESGDVETARAAEALVDMAQRRRAEAMLGLAELTRRESLRVRSGDDLPEGRWGQGWLELRRLGRTGEQ